MSRVIAATDLPPASGGRIDYVVPGDVFVTKPGSTNGTIWATPGDHIHGRTTKDVVSVGVYDGLNCLVCEAEAAELAERHGTTR